MNFLVVFSPARWARSPAIIGVMGPPYVGLFHPSYPIIRSFIGAVTPLVTGKGPLCGIFHFFLVAGRFGIIEP